jgi:hypothetical protein
MGRSNLGTHSVHIKVYGEIWEKLSEKSNME